MQRQKKVLVEEHERKAKTAGVAGFIKKHPHHKLVRKTRRSGVKNAGVRSHLRKL